MEFTTNLREVGGSVMVSVPPAILELLHLQAGDAVGIVVNQNRMVIEPWPQKRYALNELLAQCTIRQKFSAKERAWLDTAPIGRELF